jgi:transposase
MSKKHNTKPKCVDYFGVPKPLWKRIKHLFPKPGPRGRPPVHDRWALNAIWYVLWTGCQWKAVKREWFGVSSSTAHARLQLWQKLGIFDAIMGEMVKFYHKRRKIRWKWQAIDAKNCPAPLGGEETAPSGLPNPTDRGKRGSKIHILVDKRGAPLAVYLSAANRHDKCAVKEIVFSIVVERPECEQHLCADRGYDSQDVREFLELEHYVPHIKHRRRRGEPKVEPCPIPGETHYPARRWVVERTFSWLAKRRSIRVRWCKKSANWLALLLFAAAHVLFDMAFFG